LRRGERQSGLAIDEREEARLFAVEIFLDHSARVDGTECNGEAGIDGIVGFLARRGDGDAFTRGKSIGLDDDGQGLSLDISFCGSRGAETWMGGGRVAVLGAKVLSETFGAFELRGSLGGAESSNSGGLKVIGKPCHY